MREVINFNTKWAFSKEATAVPATMPERWYWVTLPHTWNDIDGQDGGNDLYRGTAYYAKTLSKVDLPKADQYYLEFNGANSSASVYVNGKKVKDSDRTTPESLELQREFAQMAEVGVEAVVMEVSSQSLKLHRVDGCEFDMVLFTCNN